MFDKLKKAFSSAAKSIGSQKEISEKVLNNTLFDLELALLESDVAQEVIDDLSAKLKKELLGLKLEKGEVAEGIIKSKLYSIIAETFSKAEKIDLIKKIKAKRESNGGGPFVVVFLGINGTGKTTTVAKIGNLLRKEGISVVVAAGDTHRAGAIEQLSQHAERLSLKVIAQRYGADPSAVGRDAVDYGRKHHIEAILIDTAGRMQTAKNLMDEIGKIVRVVKPDMKLFVGDSLAGNDTINQAREFFQYTNFDGAILTKTDADAKGGAALSIVHITSKPIVYIGIGQGYDDIIPFDSDKFLGSIFGNVTVEDDDVKHLVSITSDIKDKTYEPITTTKSKSEIPIPSNYVTEAEKRKNIEEREEKIVSTSTDIATTNGTLDTLSKSENSRDTSKNVYEVKKGEQEEELSLLSKTANEEVIEKMKLNSLKEEDEGKKKSRLSGWFRRRKKGEKIIQEEDNDNKNQTYRMENDDSRKREVSTALLSPSSSESPYLKENENRNELIEKTDSEKKDSRKEKRVEKEEKIYLTDEDIEDLLK
jgi:fused signal recognition particle receptor